MIVIIPYCNNPTDFSALLMQLQFQRIKPTAVYIADNSTTGIGMALVKRYQFNVEMVVDDKPGTIYQSWNKGISFAKERKEDVLILNDDLMVSFNTVEIFMAAIKSGAAAMYCPAVPGFPPTGRIRKHYQFFSKDKITAYLQERPQYDYPPSITGWCFALPQKTIKEIGGFDTQFTNWYGDKDYETRIFNAGKRVMFIRGVNISHFGTASYGKIEKEEYDRVNNIDQRLYETKYEMKHKDRP